MVKANLKWTIEEKDQVGSQHVADTCWRGDRQLRIRLSLCVRLG